MQRGCVDISNYDEFKDYFAKAEEIIRKMVYERSKNDEVLTMGFSDLIDEAKLSITG